MADGTFVDNCAQRLVAAGAKWLCPVACEWSHRRSGAHHESFSSDVIPCAQLEFAKSAPTLD